MKKTLSKILLTLSILLVSASVLMPISTNQAYAVEAVDSGGGGTPYSTVPSTNNSNITITNPLGSGGPSTLDELLEKISDFIFTVTLALAPIFFLYAGYQFLTAAGDPKKVQTATSTIKWAIIGVAIALISSALVDMIANFLTV